MGDEICCDICDAWFSFEEARITLAPSGQWFCRAHYERGKLLLYQIPQDRINLLRLNDSVLGLVLEFLDWRDLGSFDTAMTCRADRGHFHKALSRVDATELLENTVVYLECWKWLLAFEWMVLRGINLPIRLNFPRGSVTDYALSLLQHCSFSGRFVREVDLGVNGEATGKGLAHLKHLCGLQTLSFQNCFFISDDDIPLIFTLPELSSLRLSLDREDGLTVDTALEQIVLLQPKLTHLRLEDCKRLTSEGFRHLAALTELRHLEIGHGRSLTDATMETLKVLKKLEKLSISGEINGSGLAHLQENVELFALKEIDLAGCDLTDEGMASLQYLPGIRELRVSCCRHLTDAFLVHCSKFNALKQLDFSSCGQHLTCTGLVHLAQFSSTLEMLNLSYSSVTDAGLAQVAQFTQLRKLNLNMYSSGGNSTNLITDAGLAHIRGLTMLRELHMSGLTNITNEGFFHLGCLVALQKLDFQSNMNINLKGLIHLHGLKQLCELRLGGRVGVGFTSRQYKNGLIKLCDQCPHMRLLQLPSSYSRDS